MTGLTMDPPVASPPASVEEIAREILEDDAPNKFVWKTYETLHAWVSESLLPAIRALLSDRAAMAERVAGLERERDDWREQAQFDHGAYTDALGAFRASEAEVARLREELAIVRDLPLPETVTTENAGALALSMLHTLQWLAARARAALTRPDEPTKET